MIDLIVVKLKIEKKNYVYYAFPVTGFNHGLEKVIQHPLQINKNKSRILTWPVEKLTHRKLNQMKNLCCIMEGLKKIVDLSTEGWVGALGGHLTFKAIFSHFRPTFFPFPKNLYLTAKITHTPITN